MGDSAQEGVSLTHGLGKGVSLRVMVLMRPLPGVPHAIVYQLMASCIQ